MADVEVREISKRYDDVWAARRISFAVPAGSFTSLLGPSGCGKTTTLRLIAGFVEPDEGEVRIGGKAIDALPPWRRNLGVVFQSYALFPFMTVKENVAFGLRRRRVAAAELDERGGRGAGPGRTPGSRSALSAAALGGTATARGARPRAGHPARGAAARRAAVQSRRQAARRDAVRAQAHPARDGGSLPSSSPTIRRRR